MPGIGGSTHMLLYLSASLLYKMAKNLIILLVLLFFVSLNSARYISISTSVSVENMITGNESGINILLRNTGDESAYDVQLSLILPPGIKTENMFVGELKPDRPYKGNFTVSAVNDIIPGKYTIGILTDYKDANGYQFSSVSPNSLIVKKPTSSMISARIPGMELGDKETKKINLQVRNLDDKQHNLNIRLFLPRELRGEAKNREIRINPMEEKNIEFEISPFGALVGSSYVIFASLDYEEEGLHYSPVASGIVKIVESGGGFDFSGWIPIVAVVVLIVIVILYQFGLLSGRIRGIKKQ